MKKRILVFLSSGLLFACGGGENSDGVNDSDSTEVVEESMEFEILKPEQTGIDFLNTIKENDDFNFYNYEYIYNGGGVAVGDVNNDGLTDIFFTGNQTNDRLYLNKGELVFEDVTATAFEDEMNEGWHTGVNMVDINGDGWLDIYIARSGNPTDRELLRNLLYVNNGDMTFTEKSAEYGVDILARSTHSIFFDYDNDNDLDLYVLNHPIKKPEERFVTVDEFIRLKKFGLDADVFLENQDGKFVDVSEEAGIQSNCFGLGVSASDLDGNGYVDIYVSNDYQDPDLLYMNNGDGTFSEESGKRMKHISNFSMGNDMADFNNDGFVDVMSIDMAAEDHVRSKRNMGGMSTKNFWDLVYVGFNYQYMFNGLQMNNGNGTFSEIAQVAGISKTDWSWAPLFADFDNDGKKDFFVTNGYRREARDNDYAAQFNQISQTEGIQDYEEVLELMPTTKILNYIYKNEGDLHFEKKVEEWNIDVPVNSNGAAFADFDNDGDLDLVLNNMEEVSFIMENKLETANNYIRFKVEGEGKNKGAYGAKVKIKIGDEIQYHEIQTTRGYESSVENIVHFGIGKNQKIDEVEVIWPSGKCLIAKGLDVNKTHDLLIADADDKPSGKKEYDAIFTDISDSIFDYTHYEVLVNDFESEILLPNKMSQLGPFISKGDVNGDGLDDVYISGAADFKGKLHIQVPGKGFKEKAGPWEKEKMREEMGSAFIDVDNDGDQDLYVISGGNEYNYNAEANRDQLYINDGKGNFTKETAQRLPLMESSGQRLTVGDYDNDGDQDIYVAGRQTPGYYPFAPRSYLLQNDGSGKFIDVTNASIGNNQDPEVPNIMGAGMVTDVMFDDYDNDNDLDIIAVGEWMPMMFFQNDGNKFTNVTNVVNPESQVGWWYSLSKGDFNGDGKNDYVLGNVGANNKFHPTKEKPLELYCNDFDKNGTYDIVLAKYQDNICYPVRGRQCTSEQMPFVQEKFPTYAEFATADLETIYGEEELSNSLHFQATNFHSVVMMSNGAGYEIVDLPVYAQLGPINNAIVMDLNKDGHLDIVAAGNNYAAEVETIRYDGGRGVVLLGDGQGNFEQLSPLESGFFENEDCKDLIHLKFGEEDIVITVSNRAKAKTFLLN